VVGGDPTAAVRLPGLRPREAEVRRTRDDEFVVVPLAGDVRVNGAPVRSEALLRTGARVDVGRWTLVFVREEYADHGRPFGGRVGGELGRQRPQPPRPQPARGAVDWTDQGQS
jgi:hypothetical protein